MGFWGKHWGKHWAKAPTQISSGAAGYKSPNKYATVELDEQVTIKIKLGIVTRQYHNVFVFLGLTQQKRQLLKLNMFLSRQESTSLDTPVLISQGDESNIKCNVDLYSEDHTELEIMKNYRKQAIIEAAAIAIAMD